MGDAEIIPIGTRGQPGRGTGTRPSAAARGLAPKATAKGTAKKSPTPKTPRPEQPADLPEAASTDEPTDEQTAATDAPETAAAPPGTPPTQPTPAPARTEERSASPLAGIPVGDWLSAFQHASKELFGDAWEPQLARFLAFLRRRVSGEFEVDEYGFDPEIAQQFFMAALRPIARFDDEHLRAERESLSAGVARGNGKVERQFCDGFRRHELTSGQKADGVEGNVQGQRERQSLTEKRIRPEHAGKGERRRLAAHAVDDA